VSRSTIDHVHRHLDSVIVLCMLVFNAAKVASTQGGLRQCWCSWMSAAAQLDELEHHHALITTSVKNTAHHVTGPANNRPSILLKLNLIE
jgi:hypothetical protein